MSRRTRFTVHIEVYEGEYIVTHDTYEAESGEEAARLANEDYPGATITPVCLCSEAAIKATS
jgi:hypothetical protein